MLVQRSSTVCMSFLPSNPQNVERSERVVFFYTRHDGVHPAEMKFGHSVKEHPAVVEEL